MKATSIHLAAAALGIALFGCGSMNPFEHSSTPAVALTSSPDVPAAQGTVKIDRQPSNNKVMISVRHLARPDQVRSAAPGSQYVVWARPAGSTGSDRQPEKLGVLQLDKDLNGSLTASTAMNEFDIFVTVEPPGMSMQPQGNQVLSASIR